MRSWRLPTKMLALQKCVMSLFKVTHVHLVANSSAESLTLWKLAQQSAVPSSVSQSHQQCQSISPLLRCTLCFHQVTSSQYEGARRLYGPFTGSASCGHAQEADFCYQLLVQVSYLKRVSLVFMSQDLILRLFACSTLRVVRQPLQQGKQLSIAA